MPVAFDAVSNVAAGTGDLSWTHTPVGTPRGVKVEIVENGGTNGVSSVTYGGVAMELVAVNAKTSGEAGTVVTYFLGKNIPTGAQTVSVTVNDAVSKRAVAITVTASTNTCWVSTDFSVASDSVANPSSTLNLLGKTCFVSLALHSGQGAATGITQLTGWTNRLEHDFGAQMGGWYTYNTISSSNVACGWTQTADDAVMIATAITEAPVIADSSAVGLTESASVLVVFDARALPITILESASLAVILSGADSLTVQMSDSGGALSVSVSVSDDAAVVFIDEADLSTLHASDILEVTIAEEAIVAEQYLFIADSLSVAGSESASAVSANTAFDVADSFTVGLTEARPSITSTDGELVLSVTDSCAVLATDAVSDLFVFTDSLQNFSVADSLTVQLNGELAPPTQKVVSDSLTIRIDAQIVSGQQVIVSDGLTVPLSEQTQAILALSENFVTQDVVAVQLVEVATIEAITILNVSDSATVQVPEDVPEVATVFIVTDSLRVIADEPSDQYTQLTVPDSIAVQVSAEVLQIGGLLAFAVSDSLSIGVSESASFGTSIVGTTDSCRIVSSEVLTNSSTVFAAESIQATLSEVTALFKAVSITDSLAVQFTDAASPIFNSFIDIAASDSCVVQASESIAELVSFLNQLTVSDSASLVASDDIANLFVDTVTSDSVAIVADEFVDVWTPLSSFDSIKIGTTESGLAIPRVTVNIETFTDDTLLGSTDGTASVEVVYEAREKTTSDDLGVQCGEDTLLQYGYNADDLCLVGVGDTVAVEVVPNASPNTWNGNTATEHRNDKPKPWKYIFTDKLNW